VKTRYHFVGIGGSGMSALAQILIARGVKVSGSDRYYDLGINTQLFDKLTSCRISIFRQDGCGLEENVDKVVISTAIEDNNPDVKKAKEKNIPIIKRAELLAEIFNSSKQRIAVTGTSGKTTVTAMIGFILHQLGMNPTIINGGIMIDFCKSNWLGNAVNGNPELIVIEADESDASCTLYKPTIGLITNIHLDHKPLHELKLIFEKFAKNVKETVIWGQTLTFPKKLKLYPQKSYFVIENTTFSLPLPGVHNVYNALSAIAVVKTLGVSLKEVSAILSKFKGIKRRLQVVGKEKGITVIDDYAHNPDKIKATLNTLKLQFPRIIAIFQPHGFSPTKLLKEGLIQVFKEELRKQDILFMPEIYYVGGTVTKDISSNDIIRILQKQGVQAYFSHNREEIIPIILKNAKPKDGIVVMGARDETLSEFCLHILKSISARVNINRF
jgi:UDP-N-acetylmuramate--alanine ligase